MPAYAWGIILDWYGPYHSFDSMRSGLKDWREGDPLIYVGISHDRFFEEVEYVGISENASRRFQGEHKLKDEEARLEFWLGEPVSFAKAGRRGAYHDPRISFSESLLVLALNPPRNERRKLSLPITCCSVASRFFSNKDYETPVLKPSSMPDSVLFNSFTQSLSIYGVARSLADKSRFVTLSEGEQQA